MIGMLVQVLLLVSGLMVNFLTPLIFGIEQYGLFIKANILVYVFHRFSDVSSESLIALNAGGFLFLQSLAFNLFYFSIFLIAAQYVDVGSPLLLAGMLLSSSVLLTLYSQKRIMAVMCFLFAVVSVFIFLAGLQWTGVLSLTIENLMIFSTYPPAVMGFLVLAWLSRRELVQVSSYSALWRALFILPRMISLTLVFNLLTNFLPYIATKVLLPREIGVLRVMLAVVQSVSSIFPLNIKQIFSSMVGSENRHRLYASLMQVSAVYFLLLTCGLIFVTYFYSPLQAYVRLLSVLPLFFWSMLTERYLQSCMQGSRLLVANWIFAVGIVAGSIFCNSLDALVILYVVSIFGYSAALISLTGVPVPLRYYLLGAVCLLQTFLIEASLPLAFLLALITVVGFLVNGAGIRADVRVLRGEIK